jgi:hypothetical protein
VVLTADLVFHDQQRKETKMRVAADTDTRGGFFVVCFILCEMDGRMH